MEEESGEGKLKNSVAEEDKQVEVEEVEDDDEEEEGKASEKDDMEMLRKRNNKCEDERQGNSPVS